MASYKSSIYQAGKSGKVGGSIFARGRYGPYERIWVKPVQRNSMYQLSVYSIQQAIAIVWNSLSGDQKSVWAERAVTFGFRTRKNSGYLSGYQFFVKINRALAVVGEPIIEDCPQAFPDPQIMTGFSAAVITTPGSEDITITFSPAISAGNKMIISATPILESASQNGLKFLRVIAVKDNTFISGGSLMDAYLARFKDMPKTGSVVLFSVKLVNTVSGITSGNYYSIALGAV